MNWFHNDTLRHCVGFYNLSEQMVRTKLKMNADIKEAFSQLKPVCDVLMVCPSLESLSAYTARVGELKKEIVQELQQYLLYPLVSRIKCNEVRSRIEMHLKILDAIRMVLEKITVNSFEMYMKLETGLLSIIFDSTKPGMISDATEEVKYSTIKCLTVLMLNIPHEYRVTLLESQVPMLAQAVFVSVHIAKLEKLRVLRIAAINCVTAHTMTHPSLTVEYRMPDPDLEILAVDNMLSSILPGVLAALQDVCACTDNPTHAVIVAAIEAIHRILCIPMHDKYLAKKPTITTDDFVTMLKEKKAECDTEVSNKAEKSPKEMEKRSEEWFAMAGEKLTLITKSLVSLRVHEHYKVRKELAIFCYRILTECSTTMTHSIPLCLDVLISLSKDSYPEVSTYCTTSINTYFATAPEQTKHKTLDSLCDNFISLCISFPRILNNIDSDRKLAILNLLHGYLSALWWGRPQRLTAALSVAPHMQHLCAALVTAATHRTALPLQRRPHSAVLAAPPLESPWSQLELLERGACAERLQECCALLGGAQCAELLLDVLLERLRRDRRCEPVYVLNWMITSPESTVSMARRMVYTYIDPEVWYAPLEVGTEEAPITASETFDVTVYNPRAWSKDSVPGLYEGTVETRYTDVSSRSAREAPAGGGLGAPAGGARGAPAGGARGAQRQLVLGCLLTEGLGRVARRLRDGYETYLLKTLCLVLERIGSEYELLHLAGLKAMNDISLACGYSSVAELIKCNSDYFTNQVTVRLKKAWNCQSALNILSVVMEYSDASILDCLYGIVEYVLVQSRDRYFEKNLQAYFQTFLTFIECIRKWFPIEEPSPPERKQEDMDLLAEVREYVKDTQEAERLLSDSDFEKSTGKSVEEMYREDLKQREEDELNYDDTVTKEATPSPQHVLITVVVLQRCVHFITYPRRDVALLAMQILNTGMPVLAAYEDKLLPLVHSAWSPLVDLFDSTEPVVLRRAYDLLVTLAALSKDFIRNRTVKEVLPSVYKFLLKSSRDSYLKDRGSYYRESQAYRLQQTALDTLPRLAVDLGLEDEGLTDAMASVEVYLSNKQPKPLQALAVKFFKTIVDYDYAAAWYHLRRFCDNDIVLEPPELKHTKLEPITGTPFQHKDKDYNSNIKLIFDFMVS